MKSAAQRSALVDSASVRKALAEKNDQYWLKSIFSKYLYYALFVCVTNYGFFVTDNVHYTVYLTGI
jgi:hypothetical protein